MAYVYYCNWHINLFTVDYFTRVRLRPTAVEGSDYINASFIDVSY